MHDRAGNFGGKLERNSFFRLDVKDELIGHQVLNWRIAEQNEGRPAELNDNLGGLRGEMFSGAEIKGNVGPAPIIYGEFHGYEGFGTGIRRNVRLAAIRGHAMGILVA